MSISLLTEQGGNPLAGGKVCEGFPHTKLFIHLIADRKNQTDRKNPTNYHGRKIRENIQVFGSSQCDHTQPTWGFSSSLGKI